MIGTFAGILIFTMFKELYEDIHRMRADSAVNNTKAFRYKQTDPKYHQNEAKSKKKDMEDKVRWGEIKMGDILEIKKEEQFPSDLLLLYAENDKEEPVDIIFVDTMNLDGETNLKPRTIADSRVQARTDIEKFTAKLEYDKPNENLD